MLTDDQITSYFRDGVLVLRGLFSGAELAELQRAADELQELAVTRGRQLDELAPPELTSDHGFRDWNPDDDGLLFARDAAGRRVWRRAEALWQRDPVWRTATANPALLAAIESITGGPVAPTQESLVVKMPGAGAVVPWHRDPPGEYLLSQTGDAAGDFTCDIYLDRASVDNGCLWAIPGTHRNAENEPDSTDFDRPDAVPMEAEAGDVFFHSTGVLHGSPTNTSDEVRRTFYVHFRAVDQLTEPPYSWSVDRVAEAVRLLECFQQERQEQAAVARS